MGFSPAINTARSWRRHFDLRASGQDLELLDEVEFLTLLRGGS